MEVSTEEKDLLVRSNKKIKTNNVLKVSDMDTSDSTNAENDVKGTFSYKESLIGSAFRGQSNFSIPEQEDFASDDDEEDEEEEDCPVIRLSMEEKKRIREPWRKP